MASGAGTMKHILLLGAGFSCNWGGWSASEVNDFLPTVPALQADPHVLQVLGRTASAGGFEAALAEIQADYHTSPTPQNKAHVEALQIGIIAMFSAMEAGFASRRGWDFCNLVEFKVAGFLNRFDAIFSLNQDLLPDRHYVNLDLALSQPRRWSGWNMPGLQIFPNPAQRTNAPDETMWTPRLEPFQSDYGHQPYFKLHGAWNWRFANGEQMLIVGGNKVAAIKEHRLLTWYQEQLESYLSESDSRLMVIGYGFADRHINDIIIRAAANNSTMRLFLVDPAGRAMLPGPISAITNAGTSRRLLRDTFAGDVAEHRKLLSFFG